MKNNRLLGGKRDQHSRSSNKILEALNRDGIETLQLLAEVLCYIITNFGSSLLATAILRLRQILRRTIFWNQTSELIYFVLPEDIDCVHWKCHKFKWHFYRKLSQKFICLEVYKRRNHFLWRQLFINAFR